MRIRIHVKAILLVALSLASLLLVLIIVRQETYNTNCESTSKINIDLKRLAFKARYQGPIPQEDEELISEIRTNGLRSPSTLPYNLSKSVFTSKIRSTFSYRFIHGILKDLFSDERKGFFVEAGALDGEYLSNTLWLEQTLGWTGLLVEPDDINFRDLVFKRRKAWISHSCLSSEKFPKEVVMVSTRKFKKEVNKDHLAYRGSTHELGYESQAQGSRDIVGSSDKEYFTSQCLPLCSLLLALNVTVVDFLSLDIQGADLKVFDTLPLGTIRIRTLVIENEATEFDRSFIKYFNDKGFIWLAAGGAPDFFFIHKDEALIKKFKGTPSQTYFDNGYNISVSFQ